MNVHVSLTCFEASKVTLAHENSANVSLDLKSQASFITLQLSHAEAARHASRFDTSWLSIPTSILLLPHLVNENETYIWVLVFIIKDQNQACYRLGLKVVFILVLVKNEHHH